MLYSMTQEQVRRLYSQEQVRRLYNLLYNMDTCYITYVKNYDIY